MTWSEMAEESWLAANELRTSGRLRSCVSRAYYSAYAQATASLERQGIRFKEARDGPTHASLADLVVTNLKFDRKQKYQTRRALLSLYKARVQADYFKEDVDESFAVRALRDASMIGRALGE